MALPKLKKITTEYTTPITGLKVNVSQLTLKDQKMVASLDSKNGLFSAVYEIVKSCTDVDVEKLDPIEFQWLFLQIRRESLGDEISVDLKCGECEHVDKSTVKMSDFVVTPPKELSNTIEIGQGIGVSLKKLDITQLANVGEQSELDIIRSVIDFIYDDSDVFKVASVSDTDLQEFVDSIPYDKLVMIMDWIKNSGSVDLKHDWVCSKCGHKNSITTSGISEFVT